MSDKIKIKIKSIDNSKSEKASLILFDGDEFKTSVFLPKSVIEVDESDMTLVCSSDEMLASAMEKAKEENSFVKTDANVLVELSNPSWDVDGRASVGFDISIMDNGKEADDFNVRVFIPRSKIVDNKVPLWIIHSSLGRRIAEESTKKFKDNGIAQAMLESPDEFIITGLSVDNVSGSDINYQLKKALS